MAGRLRAYGVTAPLRILPTGLPDEAYRAGDGPGFRERHGIAGDRPMALFVGRVAHEKNIGFLLEAAVRVRRERPDMLLVVAGEGPAREALCQQAGRLGLDAQVRFLGYLDRRTELPDAYGAADLFVFASRTETQGLVLLEALAQGCPVLGLSVMGTADILDGQRGCRASADDRSAFAAAWLELLNDEKQRLALASEARRHSEAWRASRLAGDLARYYQAVLDGKPG